MGRVLLNISCSGGVFSVGGPTGTDRILENRVDVSATYGFMGTGCSPNSMRGMVVYRLSRRGTSGSGFVRRVGGISVRSGISITRPYGR